MEMSIILVLIINLLVPVCAIVGGLLIFFLGRRHVSRKYGYTPKGKEKI